MKLKNNSDLNLSHVCFDKYNKMTSYVLKVGEVLEVPDSIGKIWLGYPDIEEYVTKADLEQAKTDSVTEVTTKVTTNKKNKAKTSKK